MRKRVAIIGSDLSKELLDKNYSKIKDDFEIVLYPKNTSLISVMSESIDYDFGQLKKELSFEESQQILDELDKDTLNNLIAVQPDVLVLDFYNDAFNGVIQVDNGSFLTNSLKDMEEAYSFSNIRFQRKLSSNQSTQDFINYSRIWCKAFDSFLKFTQLFLPNTVLLVNTINLSKEKLAKNNIGQAWFRFNEYAEKKGLPVITDHILEFYQVVFNNFKINQLKNFSDLEKNDENREISEASLKYNLIRNADFSQGKRYWHDDSEEYFVKNGILEINRTSMEGFTILHGAPIQISNQENASHKFELSMEVWVENLFALHLNDAFFYVWIYDDKVNRKVQEVKICSSKLENLSSGKWKHVTIELDFKGKYLELGPHMVGAGHFRYRNLSLTLKANDEEE